LTLTFSHLLKLQLLTDRQTNKPVGWLHPQFRMPPSFGAACGRSGPLWSRPN